MANSKMFGTIPNPQPNPAASIYASAELMDDVVYAKEFDLNKEQLHHAIVEGFQTKPNSLGTSNTTPNDYEKINNGNIEWFQFDSTMTKIERYYHDETNSNPQKQGTNSRPSSGMVKQVIDPSDYNCKPAKFTAMYGSTHPQSNIINNGESEYASMVLTMDEDNKCFCTIRHQFGHEENGRIVIDKDETHMIDIATSVKALYGSPWNVLHQNVTQYKDINGQTYYYLSYHKKNQHGFLIITYNIHGELILIEDYPGKTIDVNGEIQYFDPVAIDQHDQTLLDISVNWSESLIKEGIISIYTSNKNGYIPGGDDKEVLVKNPPVLYTSKPIEALSEAYILNKVKIWGYYIKAEPNIGLGHKPQSIFSTLTWPKGDSVMDACVKRNEHDYLVKIYDIASTNTSGSGLLSVKKQKYCKTYDGNIVYLNFNTNNDGDLTSEISTAKETDIEKVMPFLAQFDNLEIADIHMAKNRAGFTNIFLHDITGNLWIARQLGGYTDGTTEQKISDPYGFLPLIENINGAETPLFKKATCLGNFDMVYVPDRFTEDSEYAYIKNNQVYLAHNTYITKTWVSDKLEIYDNSPISNPTQSKGKFYHLNIVPEDANGQPAVLQDNQYIEIRAPYPMTIIDMSTHISYRSDRYSPIYFKIKSATGKLNLAVQAKNIGCYVYARLLDINNQQATAWQNYNLSAFAHERLSKLSLSQVQDAKLPYKKDIVKAKSDADKQVNSCLKGLGEHLVAAGTHSSVLTIETLGNSEDPLTHIKMGNSQATGMQVSITDSSISTTAVSSTDILPENFWDTIDHALSDACHWVEHHIIEEAEKAIKSAIKYVDNAIHVAFDGMENMFDKLGLSAISNVLKCFDQVCQTALNTLGSLLTLPLKMLDIALEFIALAFNINDMLYVKDYFTSYANNALEKTIPNQVKSLTGEIEKTISTAKTDLDKEFSKIKTSLGVSNSDTKKDSLKSRHSSMFVIFTKLIDTLSFSDLLDKLFPSGLQYEAKIETLINNMSNSYKYASTTLVSDIGGLLNTLTNFITDPIDVKKNISSSINSVQNIFDGLLDVIGNDVKSISDCVSTLSEITCEVLDFSFIDIPIFGDFLKMLGVKESLKLGDLFCFILAFASYLAYAFIFQKDLARDLPKIDSLGSDYLAGRDSQALDHDNTIEDIITCMTGVCIAFDALKILTAYTKIDCADKILDNMSLVYHIIRSPLKHIGNNIKNNNIQVYTLGLETVINSFYINNSSLINIKDLKKYGKCAAFAINAPLSIYAIMNDAKKINKDSILDIVKNVLIIMRSALGVYSAFEEDDNKEEGVDIANMITACISLVIDGIDIIPANATIESADSVIPFSQSNSVEKFDI